LALAATPPGIMEMVPGMVQLNKRTEEFSMGIYLSADQGLRTIGISIECKVRDILLGTGVVALLAGAFAVGLWM
jgi:hypothetical protein